MKINYPLATDTWDDKEIEAIERVIKTKMFSMGSEVRHFEIEFAEYFGAKYAVMVNSGSSANLIAVAALVLSEKYNLKKGDEVIVPAVSWATTYTPLQQYGLKVRFVDIDIDTLNMDLNQLEMAVTPATKAICAVNLLGNPNDFDIIQRVCEKYNLILIEDNCESMGACFNGKFAGTFGIVGTFSTFYSHHMATMEGGMVLTDDKELYAIMKSIRAHGWTREIDKDSGFSEKKEPFYELFNFILPGYNVRPLEMEAAIGREQLKKLSGFLEARSENGKFFEKELEKIVGVKGQKSLGVSSYFGFPLIFENNAMRDKMVSKFRDKGIECRPIVAGNFTRNSVINFFDYTIFSELDNANKVHDCGMFIGNQHYDCRVDIAKIMDLLCIAGI